MSEPFGPFRDGMDDKERTAQLRTLRALVRVYFGLPELQRLLRIGETDCSVLPRALEMFDAVPAVKKRRILGTFAAIHKPEYTKDRTTPLKEAQNAT